MDIFLYLARRHRLEHLEKNCPYCIIADNLLWDLVNAKLKAKHWIF